MIPMLIWSVSSDFVLSVGTESKINKIFAVLVK